jgi:hypothetical protein
MNFCEHVPLVFWFLLAPPCTFGKYCARESFHIKYFRGIQCQAKIPGAIYFTKLPS